MRKAGSVFNCQQTVRLRLYGNAHKEPFRKGHAWAARHSATKKERNQGSTSAGPTTSPVLPSSNMTANPLELRKGMNRSSSG